MGLTFAFKRDQALAYLKRRTPTFAHLYGLTDTDTARAIDALAVALTGFGRDWTLYTLPDLEMAVSDLLLRGEPEHRAALAVIGPRAVQGLLGAAIAEMEARAPPLA